MINEFINMFCDVNNKTQFSFIKINQKSFISKFKEDLKKSLA